MTRARRAKWAALVAVASLSVASATIGVTQGAFAGQTSEGGNIITAMPDFRGPTITRVAIGKNTAGVPSAPPTSSSRAPPIASTRR